MKRRDFVLASASLAGVVLPGLGRAAQPCPPPQVSVSGGTSATTNCVITSGSSYSTNFPATENPLSDSGKWTNGKAVGLNWNNVQTVPGRAFAADFVGVPSRYNDPIAHLNTSFTGNQYAQGTVYRVPGYRNLIDKHEIELLLRFQITASSARGYEILWGQDGEIFVVRWNGPLGNYTPLNGIPDSPSRVAVDGDVLRAEITGNVIKVFRNGVLMVTATDSTFSTGQPGIGFWPTAGSSLASYGWKSFQAGSL